MAELPIFVIYDSAVSKTTTHLSYIVHLKWLNLIVLQGKLKDKIINTVFYEFQEVDVLINNLFVEYDRKNEVLGKLHESVKSLPLILSELQSLTDVLGLNK